jgi:hypothetical protein
MLSDQSVDEMSQRMAGLGMPQHYMPNMPHEDYPNYHFIPSTSQYYPHYEPYSPGFSVETMHGMPGYALRPPVTRSTQTSPLNAPSQAYSRPSTAGGYQMWASPPMSPVPGQYHSRQTSYMDEYGGMHRVQGMQPGQMQAGHMMQGRMANMQGGRIQVGHMQGMHMSGTPNVQHDPRPYFNTPPSTWNTPSTASAPFFTPYQTSTSSMDPQIRAWSSRPGRQSWAGPSQDSPEKERKPYHPQAPSRRSDWVMWVGNV